MEQDAVAIAHLSASLGYPADSAAIARRLRVLLASKADLIIVAVDATTSVIGWLQAHASTIVESGFRVEIAGVIVAPGQRRRGVGRALVHHAEQWASSLSAKAIVVRSNVERAESHAFYPALGYALARRRRSIARGWTLHPKPSTLSQYGCQ